jgi:crossover junction endodeoxyribonuclease RusA
MSGDLWRGMWRSKDAALAYLVGIKDVSTREATAKTLGLADDLARHVFASPEAQEPPSKKGKGISYRGKIQRALETPFSVTADALAIFKASEPGSISFRLPYPPSVNNYWRSTIIRAANSPAGRIMVFTSEQGKRYRANLVQMIEQLGQHGTTSLFPGARVGVEIRVCPPDRRDRDLDNILKSLLDALTHAGVYVDDALIDELIVRRGPVVPDGRVDVRVYALTASLFDTGE